MKVPGRILRGATWCCAALLGVLSLLPAPDMVRTGLPGGVEHFAAYAATAVLAVAGYGRRQGVARIVALLCAYAAALESLQHFSAGRHPALADYIWSAAGVICGALAMAQIRRSSGQRGWSGPATRARPTDRDEA